ncbi:hypothetical protein B0A54_14390 [Friedmanniomyces endolithicus]|uniref:Urea carboxylase n=1 Tax=Friedmanniomyces endolithicus TaxID=329885 RepID=A0A4U0UCI2_9PEZI|nr:hypothetical protein B0A54_14390 [Friedmanniomyces endolithicus]
MEKLKSILIANREKIGFPVMLKATGGGGGMGLVVCHTSQEVKDGFETVRSRGETLFKSQSSFAIRYLGMLLMVHRSRAVSRIHELHVFGNGQGQAIHFGERECSIQRRNQKVIEECPSPFVEKYPSLREKLGSTAVSLAESMKYGSAGTIEYIVDDKTGEFYFLEMNTRLQVEHGITEMVYDVDLVELMFKQADAQLSGKGGLSADYLKSLQPSKPVGVAIEARVYAENPLRDYAPSPGLLQMVQWEQLEGSRIDTWVFTGTQVSPNYDPLLAKVMNHAKTRDAAIKGMDILLSRSMICGPPTNLEYLAAIMQNETFQSGHTLTSFLKTFDFAPSVIDVISAGAYTLVQDLPGRPTVGKGVSLLMDANYWWKLGQIKAGNTMQYKRVSLEEALSLRKKVEEYLVAIHKAIESGSFEGVQALETTYSPSGDYGKAVVVERPAKGNEPQVRYRQGGDDHLLVEYGNEQFDLNHRCRVTALEKVLRGPDAPAWLKETLTNTVGCCTSLLLFYNGAKLDRERLVKYLQSLEDQLGDLSKIKVPCRRFRLPLSFESKEQTEATQRYMETQRPHAPYLPDNLEFTAKNNAFSPDQLKHNLLNGTLMTVVVGFFCGNTVSLPVDPRMRMASPKTNPSRVFTPEGTFGWGGSCGSIYPVDSPGGYMMLGRTVPCFDYLGYKDGFSLEKPWLFQDFDLLTFYQVTEEELNEKLGYFRSGRYKFEWDDVEFDMAEHNKLLQDTAEEVKQLREKQTKVQDELVAAENESLQKWREDKDKNKVDESTLDALLADPAISTIDSPMDANVWKVLVDEGDEIKANQVCAILEAMKLEISVQAPWDIKKGKVEKLLVRPGEIVKAGGRIALIRQEN